MNERRLFLTKDEVKSLGTELTESTTEPIKVLYLPIDYTKLAGITIKFYYWSSSSDQIFNSYYRNGSNTSTIGGDSYLVSLTNYHLLFNWGYNNMTAKWELWYTMYHVIYNRSGYDADTIDRYSFSTLTDDSYQNSYIKCNITELPIYARGASINTPGSWVGKFYLKYKEGTIPADTIFYEPGTYE